MSNPMKSADMVLKGLQSYSKSCFGDPVPCQLASKHHCSVCQGMWCLFQSDVATDWFGFTTVMTFSSEKHGCQILFTEKALLTVRCWGQMLGKMYHLRVQELWYCIQNPGPSLLCPVPSTPHHWPDPEIRSKSQTLEPTSHWVLSPARSLVMTSLSIWLQRAA